ncbi:unnamed protein product [Ectocarpus sp. CCAP 1310/34]|nr:unnamed protein product [Ectocarpus sp. CCAP 1310/34]
MRNENRVRVAYGRKAVNRQEYKTAVQSSKGNPDVGCIPEVFCIVAHFGRMRGLL